MTEQTIPPLSMVERGLLVALGIFTVPCLAFLGYLLIFHGLWQAVYAVLLPVFLATIIWQFRSALVRLRPRDYWPASLRFWLLALALLGFGAALAALFSLAGSGLAFGALTLRLGQFLMLEFFAIGGVVFVCGLVFCRIHFARLEMLALLVAYVLVTKGMLSGFFVPGGWLHAVILLPIGMWTALLSFLPAVLAAELQPRNALPLFARHALAISAMLLATFVSMLVASALAQSAPGLFPPGIFGG